MTKSMSRSFLLAIFVTFCGLCGSQNLPDHSCRSGSVSKPIKPPSAKILEPKPTKRIVRSGGDLYHSIPGALLERRLPDRDVVVASFLDGVYFNRSVKAIDQTMLAIYRRAADRLVPTAAVMSSYFALHKNQTVVVVGHVEAQSFVLTDNFGNRIRSLPLRTLLELANINSVILIPIGCNTASAGVPIGFKGEIYADRVAEVIRSISQARTLGEVIRVLESLGPLHVTHELGRVVFWSKATSSASNIGSMALSIDDALVPRYSLIRHNSEGVWTTSSMPTSPVTRYLFIALVSPFIVWLLEMALRAFAKSRFIMENRSRVLWLPSISCWMAIVHQIRVLTTGLLKIVFCIAVFVGLFVVTPWLFLIALVLLPYLFSETKTEV